MKLQRGAGANDGSSWVTYVFGALPLRLSADWAPLHIDVLTCPTPPSCQTLQLICFISHSFKKCYVPGTAPVLQMLCRDLSLVAQLIEESSSNQKTLMRT